MNSERSIEKKDLFFGESVIADKMHGKLGALMLCPPDGSNIFKIIHK